MNRKQRRNFNRNNINKDLLIQYQQVGIEQGRMQSIELILLMTAYIDIL